LSQKIVKKPFHLILTTPYLNGLNLLIREEIYEDRAEATRDALRRLFKHYGINIFKGINDSLG
jgi:Arc/MetJ-type ribon-helix-helix transcriptional regulator